MPRLGETMDEGTIAEWLVQPGQSFMRGDPLLEVETDKTMVEYPALGGGTFVEALVSVGDVVAVGTPIAVIETTDVWDGPDDASPPETGPTAPEPVADTVPTPAQAGTTTRKRATPLARRLAQQSAIDLETVNGTGRRGRIEASDVRSLMSPGAMPKRVTRPVSMNAAVFLVHGFAGLGSNWAALRAMLQRGGAKTHAPDLPGHGRNATEAEDVMTLIDWLSAALADQPEPVHLVGHSLGAHVAAKAAQRDPSRVTHLTLIAPAGCGLDINGAFLSGMASAPGVGELSHLMRLLGRKARQLDDAALTAMAQDLRGKRIAALSNAVARDDVQSVDTLSALDDLGHSVGVTAIFGLEDRIIPKEHVFQMPPSVACHMVDAGHMPHWDATEQVAAIIAET
ncbi:acetoin dehydrogenase dihydrolipoyllysine-residue acetyltransferase subunit [Marivita sp. XM-24bin2]|uniref:acetoin dehydrogenase dihydrolipoyllysine-residue acetyltransferase subunit n=1 Tax=unclassified Marivita TaxID=2632480 RepID=UPI0025BF0C77|nr:acetoin dehydrogenase dihydrolipoyllysine-residue acetyltransferase subunit [Marivita sp. XM-24bin2]